MAGQLGFGVFPLGLAGAPGGVASGPPDDFGQVQAAVERLQGDGPRLLVRMYVNWPGRRGTARALAEVAGLAAVPLPWDLMLCYRDRKAKLGAWEDFVSQVVSRYGRQLAAVQVTGEANLTSVPDGADGAFPRAAEALVRGVHAAAAAKQRTGATAAIGFAVAPDVNPAVSPFRRMVAELGGPRFAASVEFAGLDMYPDVFGPRLGLDQLDSAVGWLLGSFRNQALPLAGIGPAVPIRICENGWPTGPDRSEAQQADVLETVLRAVHARRDELNVTHWELFTLRDADSSNGDPFTSSACCTTITPPSRPSAASANCSPNCAGDRRSWPRRGPPAAHRGVTAGPAARPSGSAKWLPSVH